MLKENFETLALNTENEEAMFINYDGTEIISPGIKHLGSSNESEHEISCENDDSIPIDISVGSSEDITEH